MTAIRTLAAAVAATLVFTPVVAEARTVATIEQGSQVVIGGDAGCTVGYNDVANGTSYTAAHCGVSGERVKAEDDNGQWVELGTFYASGAYVPGTAANDWAMIAWDPGVQVGSNVISGSTVIGTDDVRPGDEVCSFGGATGAAVCGPFIGAINDNLYWDADNGIGGDSGGPVWVPNKGFVALYSGFNIVDIEQPSGELIQLHAQRGSAPVVGAPVSDSDEITLIVDYFETHPEQDANVDQTVEKPIEPNVDQVMSSSGSSTTPVILATVFGVLITLAAALLPLISTLQLPFLA